MGKKDFWENVEKKVSMAHGGTVYKMVIGNTERVLIENALEKTFGNQVLAARLLGLNRNTIRTKIKKLNILTEKFKR